MTLKPPIIEPADPGPGSVEGFTADSYRALVQSSPDVILTVDQDRRISSVNPAFNRIFGYEAGEALGRSARILHPNEEAFHRFGRLVYPEINNQGSWRGEWEYRTKDGSRLVMDAVLSGLGEPGSKQYLAILRDISARKRSEQATRESEERYRTVVDLSPDPILIHREGKVIFTNQATLDLLGVDSEDHVLGKFVWEFNSEPLQTELARKRLRLMEAGHTVPWLPFDLLRPDGGQVAVEATGRMVPFPGGRAVLTVWRDVTEQRRAEKERAKLEAQLRHSQKLEAVGTLAGGIAHDFNNILAAILGYSELSLRANQKGRTALSELEKIVEAVGRAKVLVRQILAFSHRAETELKPLNVAREIGRAEAIIQRTIPKMVSVKVDLAEGLYLIKGDPVQMEQVFLNLASNAKDAMPDGGELLITARNVILGRDSEEARWAEAEGEYLLITVSDTGQGMTKEVLERVFEPFFTTKGVGQGTGLGLASVYGIVRSHEGYITCASEPGSGTTFEIILPALATDQMPEEIDRPDTRPLGGRGEEILLVDDEEAIRDIGRDLLTESGYRVLTAESGEQALALYTDRLNDIELVILDLSMPGMGGRRCLTELLRIDPRARVIIASGYSRDGQVDPLLTSGAAGFLAKPFKFNELLKTVREALDA